MKKVVVVLLLICFLTGCNAKQKEIKVSTTKASTTTITCTNNNEIYQITYAKTIKKIIYTKDIEVNKENINEVLKYDNNTAKKYNSVKGLTLVYNKKSDNIITKKMTADSSKINLTKLKNNLEEYYNEDEFYNGLNDNINSFKEKYLKGYNCD